MQIGDTIIYSNGDRDKIIGESELAGKPIFLLEPQNYRPFTDTFKSKQYVKRLVESGAWKIERRRVRLKDAV